jgi:hypothetical protein
MAIPVRNSRILPKSPNPFWASLNGLPTISENGKHDRCAAAQPRCRIEGKDASDMVNSVRDCRSPLSVPVYQTHLHPPRPNGQTGPISQSLYVCVCCTTCAGWCATPTRVLPRSCYPPDLKCRRMGVCHGIRWLKRRHPFKWSQADLPESVSATA